jgi:hypothetical protein
MIAGTRCKLPPPGFHSAIVENSLTKMLRGAEPYASLAAFSPSADCAAARRAIGTRKGEHET